MSTDRPPAITAEPPTSPPAHQHQPTLSQSRRRSVSRSSQGSAFRSSLGGKPISYGSMRRTGSQGRSSQDFASESALSDSEAGSENGMAKMFGSFSHTREEIRDGTARLAAISLSAGSPPPPSSEGSDTSKSAAHSSTGSSSPFSDSLDAATPSRRQQTAVSNLAKARPTQLDLPTTEPFLGDHTSTPSPIAEEPSSPVLEPSPSSSTERTPLASQLALPSTSIDDSQSQIRARRDPEDDPSPGSSTSGGEGGKTPTPKRMIRHAAKVQRKLEQTNRTDAPSGAPELRKRVRKSDKALEEHTAGEDRVLGDERGGEDLERLGDDENLEAEDSGTEQSEHRSEPTEPNERTPLFGLTGQRGGREMAVNDPNLGFMRRIRQNVFSWGSELGSRAKKTKKEDIVDVGKIAVGSIPAVILGTLMNILDGVSYGLITFPTQIPAFADFGGIGISMFFVSCIVAQIVFTGGGRYGSIFKGGNASMMIEVVPFFHAIVGILDARINDNETLIATTLFSFALSSVLTGLAFGLLGTLRLGRLSEFFPRHILVGTIGGVGAFLFVTGLQVSTRIGEDSAFSLELVRYFFKPLVMAHWGVPLVLAVVLRLITARWKHPLIFPGYFLAIPVVFYAITFACGISVEQLRENGYVFELSGVDSKWYEFWSHYNFKKTDWLAVAETIPTQLALVFFGLLHVPINLPSLAISIGEDNVDTDKELLSHGISNIASGLIGSVPNYLCYVNSVLFYEVGGTTRIASSLLAVSSFGVLVAGPGVIGFLPICVVAALIFILGIDLVKEALWDTRGRVARFEYFTIWTIVVVMTVWDFVIGLGAGLVLACVSFVVMSSQRRAIRSILTGSVARSTVRRHPKQTAFLREVGKQVRVIKLQGFLFFGTISSCEATIRKILEAASWTKDPIRFLVLDFSMASGVDFSAAEAFVRMQRLLDERGVQLVFCGCPVESSVANALLSVGLWSDGSDEKVTVLENLNDALEHCENAFLRSLYSKTFKPAQMSASTSVMTSQIDMPKSELDSDIEGFAGSPRANHLRTAAKETISRTDGLQTTMNFQQPMPILMQSLKPYSPDLNEDYCFRLSRYFKRVHIERGTSLWTVGSEPDAFYVIESGMLRANYVFSDHSHTVNESMVAGTIAGELSFLSRTRRNTNVVAERDSVLWKMEVGSHEELGKKEGWVFARQFEEVLLKIANAETEVLLGHLMSSL
ncbi:Vsb1p [Sporobolomyces koalae]|uniref:Vsb1p n=1 Tax=Sporobolomyces koalae TaxID=500713 RepID=UPI003180423D